MAVAAQQTRVAVGEDHAVRVDRKIVIDPRTGRAAEVENVTVAVDMGDGNIAVAQQQRITGYQTEGARYGATPVYQQPRSRPALTYPDDPGQVQVNHLLHCIICIFCPCWIIVWLLCCCAYGV